MGRILIGISAWADPELIKSGFYPPSVKTGPERLNYYAQNFSIVEMDSAYHFMPRRRNLESWINATPDGFVFDVKAFSLFTHHPTPLNSIPFEFREAAGKALKKGNRLYIRNLPENLADSIWGRFVETLLPLDSAGRLGLITFQFPPWFHPNPENYDYLALCKKKLPQYPLAIEFRTAGWLNEENRQYTLKFLRDKDLSLACVDEPQGLMSSVPAVAEVTRSPGVVRFHGRNRDNWERKEITLNEKYNYLYTEEELREWVPRILRMAENAGEVYAIFENKHLDYAIKNARQMKALLAGY